MSEYPEEEYIINQNDPYTVEKITTDYTIPIEEEVQSFEDTFETVRSKITDLTRHDKSMEQKVLDSLMNGDFD